MNNQYMNNLIQKSNTMSNNNMINQYGNLV